jgi:hypothetical protein
MMSAKPPKSRSSNGQATERRRSLLLFGFLYGHMTGAVFAVFVALDYLRGPSGKALCADWKLEVGVCQGGVALAILVAFLVSGLLGVRAIFRRGS